MTTNNLVRWLIAGIASAIICTGMCAFFGFLLPTWLVGPDKPTDSYTGQVFSVALSFASAYSVLGFFVLMVFLHRRLMPKP